MLIDDDELADPVWRIARSESRAAAGDWNLYRVDPIPDGMTADEAWTSRDMVVWYIVALRYGWLPGCLAQEDPSEALSIEQQMCHYLDFTMKADDQENWFRKIRDEEDKPIA